MNPAEILTATYVVLSLIATYQTLRKKRSAFAIGLVSQIVMVAAVIVEPKLHWFLVQMFFYGLINIRGLFCPKWKMEPWW